MVFSKIDWFRSHVGDHCLLLPHRVEFVRIPMMWTAFLLMVPWKNLISVYCSRPGPNWLRQMLAVLSISNRQESSFGLFVLSGEQLKVGSREHWLDGDLLSLLLRVQQRLASLNFRLYKPAMAIGSWLELCTGLLSIV